MGPARISWFGVCGTTTSIRQNCPAIYWLWQYSEKNFSPHEHPPKAKVARPKKKGEKATPVEQITVLESAIISGAGRGGGR